MSAPRLLAGPLPGSDPVFGRGIAELRSAMAAGALSAMDLVRAYLARIAAHDQAGPALNAVIALNSQALAEAADRDRERQRGAALGPLHGIPLLLKDNIDTVGMPATAGSLALAGRRPQRDADVVRRLREAGAVVLGKTTMHELACGITNVSSLSGRTRNAYDAARVPGGSSGGSAVAVASSFAAAAIGTDTSGSIRIPAAFNQVWGLRPTAGRYSNAGVVPLSPTLDTVGPMARSLADISALWSVMAGQGEDARGADRAWRIGTLEAFFGPAGAELEVSRHVRAALAGWQAEGAQIQPVALALEDARLTAANVTGHEFRDALALCLRDAGLPVRSLTDILDGGYPHPEVAPLLRERDALRDPDGSARLAVLARAQVLRDELLTAMDQGQLDLLAYPSVRGAPALLGQAQRGGNGLLAAVTGLPALSVPIGFTPSGIPVGLELLGRAGSERQLFQAARRFQA
ncbi:amidase [Achromobacter sp. ACM03]|uniref:amidase n=1 Tax=Achromobacter TaxID=222 RepID=UPI001466A71A|nr:MULTISPECIES: amidase [Achromobacter]MBD9430846.1 amidase [Achromobacter sp. ACM03]CAB3812306.1 Mandelamide hydrolase [Achromobacter aegrifaciens]